MFTRATIICVTWATVQGFVVLADTATHQNCRAAPGSPDWPSPREWASLNKTLDGRLLQPTPPGAVCHAGWPTFNPEQCPAVQKAWRTYAFHDDDASLVSTYENQFSNDTCLPDPKYPCSAAGYPNYVINATTAEHVKAGVHFARKNNVRLVVRGSGCDFIGRSNAPNSLSISTRNIKGMTFNPKSFRPRGCKFDIDGPSITAGGGSQMAELYSMTDKYNQTVIGAGGETVGIGGFITGGGHGLLAARYGLAADLVLEMEVVTPAGDIVVANECQNQDLFWAMRGGGGSTFGVMTLVTMQTLPSPQLAHLFAIFATPATDAKETIFDAATYVVSQFPYLESKGISGYTLLYTNIPNPVNATGPNLDAYFLSMTLQDTQDPSAVDAIWDPIFAHVNTTWPQVSLILKRIIPYPSFSAWYAVNLDSSATGTDHWPGSRLIDAATLSGNQTALREALKAMAEGDGYVFPFLLGGRGVWNAKPRGGSNSVVPAWRKAVAHIATGLDFQPLNATAKALSIATLENKLRKIRELAPHMGAYMSEASPFEPDFQRQFWGSNYRRLLRIKRELDPDDVFWCTPCVGNERWEEVDGRLCRKRDRELL